jgi:hypothetical protein
MKKSLYALVVGLLLAVPHPGAPAEAAIVKTTITVSTPTYLFASVGNPIDVGVCSKARLSATVCESVSERSVTLWANNVKVQTLKTVAGVASFNWTPKTSGNISLKATVATTSSTLRAASSEAKKVTVKSKTKGTTISVISCAASCKAGLPSIIDIAGDGAMFAGIDSGVTKGRKIRIQNLRVTNKFEDKSSASSTWQSDLNKYGMAVSYDSLDPYNNCTPGSTMRWNFRFYVDATSKSPAAATKAKWIDLTCPPAAVAEDIEMDFSYYDQTIDSSIESPASAEIYITAPDSSAYSIWTEYCSKDTDCSEYSNWTFMDGYVDSETFGSRSFSLSMDPEGTGSYWVQVVVIPETDQAMFFSDWYSLTID